MDKLYAVRKKKAVGDTAVDGLIAGIPAGLAMALVLILTGLLDNREPLVTLSFFDPLRSGSWLTGLLAHLAVAAMYGLIFALLIGVIGRIKPSLIRLVGLWGVVYGLILLAIAYGVWFSGVQSPLADIVVWQMGAAHVVYGLVLGLWLRKNQ